jgi:RNA polymerase sigma-70 factor (ECF subfamily)
MAAVSRLSLSLLCQVDGGNPTDAEDALSRAMLKAWEKVQKYAGEIANFKAWLTTLTRNLCVDIHRERSRGANRVEDIEGYASGEEQGLVAFENTPDSAVETGERRIMIRRAIDNLPTRLRETFILHFYQELSYPEIAEQQEISYQNVCKRISQARKILQQELRGYFVGEEGTDRDKSVTPTVTESEIGEMSEGNGGVEADAGETVTLLEAVEEVDIVGGEEAQEVAGDVQQSESVMVAATFEGKLEVRSDGCRWVEVVLCERQFAPTLAWVQFDEETGHWGNFCLVVQGKVAGDFVRFSRSPPFYPFPYFQFLSIVLGENVSKFKNSEIEFENRLKGKSIRRMFGNYQI